MPCPAFWHPPSSETDRLELFCICRNPWPGVGISMRPAWCRCIPVDSPVLFSRVQCDYFRSRTPPVFGGQNLQWCPCTYPPGHPHGHFRWSVSLLESSPLPAVDSNRWIPLRELSVSFTHPGPVVASSPITPSHALASSSNEGIAAPVLASPPPVDDLFSSQAVSQSSQLTAHDLCPVIDLSSEASQEVAMEGSVVGDGDGDVCGSQSGSCFSWLSSPEPLLSDPPDNTGFLDPSPELCAWFIGNAVEGAMPALSSCQQCPCNWTPGRRHLRWTLASDPVRLARFSLTSCGFPCGWSRTPADL